MSDEIIFSKSKQLLLNMLAVWWLFVSILLMNHNKLVLFQDEPNINPHYRQSRLQESLDDQDKNLSDMLIDNIEGAENKVK